MKTSKLLAVGLALGLLSTTARAQELIHVVLNLNFTVQADPNDVNGVTTTPPPKKLHAGNKDILIEIATVHGTNYPANAGIAFTNGGFVVVDTTGAVLDSIPELTIDTGDSGNRVTTGSSNDATNAGHRKALSIATLSFDDTGEGGRQVQFTASGIFTSNRTVTNPAADNSQTQIETATGSFAGQGTVGGRNAIVSGTIAAHGKGLFAP